MKSIPADILWLVLDAAVEHLDAQIFEDAYRFTIFHARLRGERLRVPCACALTCKAMLPRARFHLYRSIALYDRSRLPSFARTMAECDDLAFMVKHLTFGLAQFNVSAKDNDHFGVPFPPHVVARLSNLQSLEIGGARNPSPMPPAALDFAKMFAAACPLLLELSLTRLDFDSFADLVGVIWSFPHIQKVTISYLYWRRPTTGVTRLPTTPRCCNNLTTVVAGVCISSAAHMFAGAWGANVKTLLLQPGSCMHEGEFSSFLRLEELELQRSISSGAAVRVLGKIRSEHLRILQQHVKDKPYAWILEDLTEEGGEMDAILSQPMFRSLRRVSLTIIYRNYSTQRNEARWVEDVTACFPGLQGRGILHVSARCKRYRLI
ncbi:hypothetical protein C8Q74DRAFT_317343 [Fomes fomentarius]|nr:hypothetical protein C8Q74DRAFT_317343 [Fomes fomentarius]